MKQLAVLAFSFGLGICGLWGYNKYFGAPAAVESENKGGSREGAGAGGGEKTGITLEKSGGGIERAAGGPAEADAREKGKGGEKEKPSKTGAPDEKSALLMPRPDPGKGIPPAANADEGAPGAPAPATPAPSVTAPSRPLPPREPVDQLPKVLGGLLDEAQPKDAAGHGNEASAEYLTGAPFEKLKEITDAAQNALQSGDTVRGLGMMRDVFISARNREDVNVVPVARQLANLTTGEEEKMPYFLFLAEKDPDPAWIYRSSLNGAAHLAGKQDPDAVRSAWKLITRAYLNARTPEERRKPLALLEPFLETHLYSRRFSPILTSHAVKEGESLTAIREKYQTSVDSIMRINQLKSATIQPRQRLLILPGKTQVVVKKREFRLWVLVGGNILAEKRVGLGQGNSTPVGHFTIRDCIRNPTWYRQGLPPLPAESPENILGTRWLGFQDTEEHSGFGIHGTRQPDSIGKEVSSGCIRLLNQDIESIFDFIPARTEVMIED